MDKWQIKPTSAGKDSDILDDHSETTYMSSPNFEGTSYGYTGQK